LKVLDLSVKSKTENVGRIVKRLGEFCKENSIDKKVIEMLQVATDEAITNIILHSYKNIEGIINITFTLDEKIVIIKLIDFGKTFIPNKKLYNNNKKMKIGGYGLILMNKLMDDINFSYDQKEKTNKLIMKKYLS
jgi:anti-sigma regulatory factor (Ser/Thr protein kinase)